jgi:hypothetical protein
MYILACSLPHTYFSGIATGEKGMEDHDILHFHILLSFDIESSCPVQLFGFVVRTLLEEHGQGQQQTKTSLLIILREAVQSGRHQRQAQLSREVVQVIFFFSA